MIRKAPYTEPFEESLVTHRIIGGDFSREPRRCFGPLCWSGPEVYSHGFSVGCPWSIRGHRENYHLWVAGAFSRLTKSWKGIQ